MPGKSTYKIVSNDCNIQVTYSNGTVKGGNIGGYEFFCNCRSVKAIIGGKVVYLDYDNYIGSETLEEWKAFFSCSDSVTDKTFEGNQWYYHVDDTDKVKTPVSIGVWFDGTSFCYVLAGEVPAEDGSNLLDISNYTIMNNAGTVIPENLSGLTTPACVTLLIPAGGSITFADVLAEAVADGVLLPDGTAPTGLLNYNITVFQIGQLAKDAAGVKTKVGSQAVTLADDEVINAGSTYCLPPRKLKDADGDCFVEGEDLTTVIENCSTKEPAAIRVCADFIPLDADDADDTVQ